MMNLRKLWMLFACFGASMAGWSASTEAAGTGGFRRVIDIGCHYNDTWCFVTLEGAAFGPASCLSNEFRFDSSGAGGKNFYAAMLMAFSTGRGVSVELSDTACYGPWPTPLYFHVQ